MRRPIQDPSVRPSAWDAQPEAQKVVALRKSFLMSVALKDEVDSEALVGFVQGSVDVDPTMRGLRMRLLRRRVEF